MQGQSLALKPQKLQFASRHPFCSRGHQLGFLSFVSEKNQLLCPNNWKNREYNKNTQKTPCLGGNPTLLWVQTTSCCPMAAKEAGRPGQMGELTLPLAGAAPAWCGPPCQAPPPAGNWVGAGAGEAGGGHRAAPAPASPRQAIHACVASIS